MGEFNHEHVSEVRLFQMRPNKTFITLESHVACHIHYRETIEFDIHIIKLILFSLTLQLPCKIKQFNCYEQVHIKKLGPNSKLFDFNKLWIRP